MDVYLEPASWPERKWDPHLLVAAGLASFSGYLLFVVVLAIVERGATPPQTLGDARRVPVRIETRAEPEPPEPIRGESLEARAERALTTPPVATEAPAVAAPATVEPASEAASMTIGRSIDLTLPEPEPMRTMPPVCRAGPCAPGTATLPRIRPERRPADEVIADLDPEVLEGLDLEALGIDPDFGDVYGEQRIKLNRHCDLVKPEDNAITRQMGMPQFLRCRRSTASKTRAQALLDALREKRPDLFEDR